jgi:hypothetical protein
MRLGGTQTKVPGNDTIGKAAKLEFRCRRIQVLQEYIDLMEDFPNDQDTNAR